MVDVWSKDQRIHQDGNFHKSLGRYLQRRSLNSCLVRLACLLGRKMMEDKIALMEMLDALSEDHPDLEDRLKKMGGVKVLASNLGTDLTMGIDSKETKERAALFGMKSLNSILLLR